jgi:hypothetical protein
LQREAETYWNPLVYSEGEKRGRKNLSSAAFAGDASTTAAVAVAVGVILDVRERRTNGASLVERGKYALARAAMERLPAYLAWSGLAWFGYERWTMV